MKILVGLSGGVDSSAAAYLLRKAGHEVLGATMSIWDKADPAMAALAASAAHSKDACFSPHEEADIEEARAVCAQLGIPYHVFDCSGEYRKIVLENFKREYLAGRTPNPCVRCNSLIKFEALPRAAQAAGLGFDKFATGHYARVSFDEASRRWQLRRAKDLRKDQSYFIYRLTQEQLAGIMFPLGELSKAEVREVAKSAGLKVFDKKDSQDFYSGEVADLIGAAPKIGNFVDRDGRILGQHNGIWNFTVGQRKGLGVSAEKPLYVLGFNVERNEVVLGFDEETGRNSMVVGGVNWVSIGGISEPRDAQVKVRSASEPVAARLVPVENGDVCVEFAALQKAIAPGQSAVFYDGDLILGGGIIK